MLQLPKDIFTSHIDSDDSNDDQQTMASNNETVHCSAAVNAVQLTSDELTKRFYTTMCVGQKIVHRDCKNLLLSDPQTQRVYKAFCDMLDRTNIPQRYLDPNGDYYWEVMKQLLIDKKHWNPIIFNGYFAHICHQLVVANKAHDIRRQQQLLKEMAFYSENGNSLFSTEIPTEFLSKSEAKKRIADFDYNAFVKRNTIIEVTTIDDDDEPTVEMTQSVSSSANPQKPTTISSSMRTENSQELLRKKILEYSTHRASTTNTAPPLKKIIQSQPPPLTPISIQQLARPVRSSSQKRPSPDEIILSDSDDDLEIQPSRSDDKDGNYEPTHHVAKQVERLVLANMMSKPKSIKSKPVSSNKMSNKSMKSKPALNSTPPKIARIIPNTGSKDQGSTSQQSLSPNLIPSPSAKTLSPSMTSDILNQIKAGHVCNSKLSVPSNFKAIPVFVKDLEGPKSYDLKWSVPPHMISNYHSFCLKYYEPKLKKWMAVNKKLPAMQMSVSLVRTKAGKIPLGICFVRKIMRNGVEKVESSPLALTTIEFF